MGGIDWHAIHVLFTVALAIFTVISAVRRDDRTALNAEIGAVKTELTAVKARVETCATHTDFDRLRGRVEGISRSVTKLETDIQHVPQPNQVTDIISKLSSAITGIDDIKRRLGQIEHRFENYEDAVLAAAKGVRT